MNLVRYRDAKAEQARRPGNDSRAGRQEMFRFISLAFGRTPKPRYPHLSIEPEVEDAIVASHSHGSVRVQTGMFDTKADIDAEYERIRETKFAL